MCLPDPVGKQRPGWVAERLDCEREAASVGVKVINRQLPLRRRILRRAHGGYWQIVALLVRPMPCPEGVLRRIAELADGESSPLAQRDVKLNRS